MVKQNIDNSDIKLTERKSMFEYYEKEYSPLSFELGNLLYMFDFAINQQQINGYEYDFELLWDEIVESFFHGHNQAFRIAAKQAAWPLFQLALIGRDKNVAVVLPEPSQLEIDFD